MITPPVLERDERTVAVENAGFKWGFNLLCYGLLIDVILRSVLLREAPWDLLVLVIGVGAFCTAYQGRQKVLSRRWIGTAVLLACVAAAVGAVFAFAAGHSPVHLK